MNYPQFQRTTQIILEAKEMTQSTPNYPTTALEFIYQAIDFKDGLGHAYNGA